MKTQTITKNQISLHHVSGTIPCDFWSEAYHSHDHAEIFIHVLGEMTLFIENNVYFHNGNEIRVYAPHELHFGRSDFEQQMEWYQISLDASFFKDHPCLANKIVNRPKGCNNVFVSKKHESIISLLQEIFKKQDGDLGECYLYANIVKILCILNEEENNIDVAMGKNECLQNILEILNKEILHIKGVSDISKLTHFSESYIHRLFRKHLNITPHQYIKMKKLSKAKELLSNGASISEACFNSGFDDYANFITLFRKYYGVTPNKHKKSHI